jgi:hypothetical protein
VNGKRQDVEANQLGSLNISVPAGFNHIIVQLDPPFLRRISFWISLASFTGWCLIMMETVGKLSR